MLQDNKALADAGRTELVGAKEEGLAEIIERAIGILRRQYVVVIFVALLGVGAGFIYLQIAAPIYTAKASLLIDSHSRSPLGSQSAIFSGDPLEIESQIEIIKSDAVALNVIRKLQLMSDPAFNQRTGFISYLLGYLMEIGGTTRPSSEPRAADKMIGAFESGLKVEPVSGRVISISYSSSSPSRAAEITNAIAQAYITDQLEARYDANRVATNWLQERLKELHNEADTAQRAVEAFKSQNNIVTAGGRPLDDQQVADLNSRLVASRAQTSDTLARLNRIQAVLNLGPDNADINVIAGVISDSNSSIATGLRQQYLEMARRESDWSARYGKDHIAVVNLRNRMREIRQSMFDELRRSAEVVKNDYEAAKQRQEEIEKQLANTIGQSHASNQAQVTLRGLESTADGYNGLYESFLKNYMEGAQQASFPISDARVISPASAQQITKKPKAGLILALSIVGGIGLGLGLGMLRDIMDRVVRTGKQLESALQVPCIALVPLLKSEQAGYPSPKAKPRRDANEQKEATNVPGIYWTVCHSPLSSFAEAIRSIKLAIDLHMATRSCKVIGFTSTLPNEGKSTLAASVAQLAAQAGRRVLLVDCDLRNPTLSRMLAPGAAAGVVDVISGRSSVTDTILTEPRTSLAIMPAGKKIPRFLTSEILSGEPMSKLFESLRQYYEYIIVDLPPLVPIVDVRGSTHLIDSFILTVEWGRTRIDLVEHALSSAVKVYDGLIGAVLNKTDMNFIKRYDSSGAYNYDKHYARYGYTE